MFQCAVVAKHSLIVIMQCSEQATGIALPERYPLQFVGLDLNSITSGGPVLHRHGVAICQPFDTDIESYWGRMWTSSVIYRYNTLHEH
jgi:hypothetical protein